MSASELWVGGQQAIPDWARGRLTAAIITISQGATVLGGVIWSALVANGGATKALLEAEVLFSITILRQRETPGREILSTPMKPVTG